MAIKTGQRTSENFSDSKTAAQRSRAAKAKSEANTASKKTAPQKNVSKSDSSKKVQVEIANTPFNDEEVEIYNALDADIERREGRAPSATPVKKVKVGDGKGLELSGLKKGLYLVYSPDSGRYLEIKVK